MASGVEYDSSSVEDDIDNISLLPDRKRKPRRRRIRRNRAIQKGICQLKKMCGPKTILCSSLAAILMLSVVLLAVLVRPSSSDSTEGRSTEKRSAFRLDEEKHIYKDTKGDEFNWQNLRLPTDIKPLRYLVYLHPNLTTFHFSGKVDVLFKCEKATSEIVLHAKHMTFAKTLPKVVLIVNGKTPSKNIGVNSIRECQELEMISIELKEPLEKGKIYFLKIEFESQLADKLVGFYKSSYHTKSGETR